MMNVQVAASPTPTMLVKNAQILYETPQLATVAKEDLGGFTLKNGWVTSISYT